MGNNTNSSDTLRFCAAFAIDYLTFAARMRIVILVVFIFVITVGFIGNTLTICAIMSSRKHRRSIPNIFITNLAFADLLFVLSLIWRTHNTVVNRWIFGAAMCAIISAIYYLNMFASIFTMVLISVGRLLAVRFPLKFSEIRSPRNASIMCLLVWFVCLVIVSPIFYYSGITPNGNCECVIPDQHQRPWDVFQLVVGLVVPTVIMVACYGSLVLHLRRCRRLIRHHAPDNSPRVTRMVVLVSVVFVFCWTPRHIIVYFKDHLKRWDVCGYLTINVITHTLEYISSCCNPFIYWISSQQFRKMYQSAIRCQCSSELERRSSQSNRRTRTWTFVSREGNKTACDVPNARRLHINTDDVKAVEGLPIEINIV